MTSSGNTEEKRIASEPYIGLRPFAESERDRFFGRDREIRILLDKIRANRLTLLLASSGVGKSSLLQAGVMPKLREADANELIYHRNWSQDPGSSLKQTVIDYFQEKYPHTQSAVSLRGMTLRDILRGHTLFSTGTQIIILDQFEEFFNYQRFKSEFTSFLHELSGAILDRTLPAHFVLSMREDFALELNALKNELPGIFDNYFRLEKLTKEKARQAISNPLKNTGYSFAPSKGSQPGLLDQLQNDLASREQAEQLGIDLVMAQDDLPLLVEPPHLQIVCRELWQHHRDDTKKLKTLEAYQGAGGTSGILEYYFLDRMKLLGKQDQQYASLAFDHLTGQRSVKIALPLSRLAELAHVEQNRLQSVLDTLQNSAILRRSKRGKELWYELYHDLFAGAIEDWNRDFKLKQRNRQLRKRIVTGAVVTVLVGLSYSLIMNLQGRYLQLSEMDQISDRVEIYQGSLSVPDLFRRHRFLYETPFVRKELEADKLISQENIGDFQNTRAVLIGRLPMLDRFPHYMDYGLYSKGNELSLAILESNKPEKIALLADQLVGLKAGNHFGRIMPLLESGQHEISTLQTIGCMGAELAVPVLVERLDDDDYRIRKTVADVLGRMGVESVVPVLIERLDDPDRDVRRAIVNALYRIGGESIVPVLIERLSDNDRDVRRKVAMVLGRMGAVSAVPALIVKLDDTDGFVREGVVEALGRIGVESVLPALIKRLEDEDYRVRRAVAVALSRMVVASSIPALIEGLNDDNYFVRREFAVALGFFDVESTLPALIERLDDEEGFVRKGVVDALGRMNVASVVPVLIQYLVDEKGDVRGGVVVALGSLGVDSVVPLLIERLDDDDDFVRQGAIDALGRMGAESAVPALVEQLVDEDYRVRRAVVVALGRMGLESVVPALIKRLDDNDVFVRGGVVDALGRIGLESTVPVLIGCLADDTYFVRRAAVTALGRIGIESAAPVLFERLEDEDYRVRGAAAVALGRMRVGAAVPVLIDRLEDDDYRVRGSAAIALGRMGVDVVIPVLLELLNGADDRVREAAAIALGRMGRQSVVPALIKHLDDNNKIVQRGIINALGRMGGISVVDKVSAFLNDRELRSEAALSLSRLNKTAPEFTEFQNKELQRLEKLVQRMSLEIRTQAAVDLGVVFTSGAVAQLAELLNDKNWKVVVAAVKSMGQIGEYRPDLVLEYWQHLFALVDQSNWELQKAAIHAMGRLIAFRGSATSETFSDVDREVRNRLRDVIINSEQKKQIRLGAISALASTGREECGRDLYDILKNELNGEKNGLLRFRCLLQLEKMEYPVESDWLQQQLQHLVDEKADWRHQRDRYNLLLPWPDANLEKLYAKLLAQNAANDKDRIDLLRHPLYQVRQGTVHVLAATADSDMISEVVRAVYDFSASKHPSPFPYTAFQVIDRGLWNLEHKGDLDDLAKLEKLLLLSADSQETAPIPAIQERLKWTVDRLRKRFAEKLD